MKKNVWCIVTLLLSSVLSAQEAEAELSAARQITVDDAVILAADNNISLKQQKLSLDLLEKKKDYSWNSISPSLSLSGGYSGSVSGTHDAWAEGNQVSSDSLSATASLNLSFSPSLYTSIQSAKLSYEAGEISYESAVRSIELSVRKSFYKLLFDKENISLQENALESARQTYESSQYNYESKIPSIESLKNSYGNSLSSFKQVLGLDLREKIELIGSLEDAAETNITEDSIMVDLDEIPDVKSVRLKIDAAKNSLLATRFSAWGPTVSASASANENLTNEVFSINYGLTVSIPLDGYLPWSSRALNVSDAKASLESLNLELENTRTSYAIQIRNSYNTILQAQTQLSTYEKNVDLMQRTYDMTQRAYNAGSSDLTALQTAADNLASARNTLQNQRYTIISAVLDLENTLGVPFGTLTEEK